MVKPITYGRMGNFLFQAAAAAAYAWKHGLEYTLPNEPTKKGPVYLQHLVNPAWDPDLQEVLVTEQGFAYQELPFQSEWRDKNILLDGYWQSEKYFAQYRDQLLEQWCFSWIEWKGYVSVHVRRGDFLRLHKKHPPIGKDWIVRAMKLFPGYRFVFFSDDIAWCKATFAGPHWITFSEGRNEVEDLCLMSGCENQICSASTFSWWGAWLNRNASKRVIMPKLWFVPGWGGLDTKDIVPPEWERL